MKESVKVCEMSTGFIFVYLHVKQKTGACIADSERFENECKKL